MSEYLDNVFDGLKSISYSAEDIRILAVSLTRTGNTVLGTELQTMSEALTAAEQKIRHAVAKEMTQRAGGK
jgi:hypothetical protein